MRAMHWAAPAVYHMHAQHCMTSYSTIPHSQELFCFHCWLPLAFIAIFEKPPCTFSPGFCLNGFVVEFCFSHFLFFWRDIWENLFFVPFGLFVLILRISRFFPFSINLSFWLFFVLMMMIAFITVKSNLLPWIEGLCAHI